MHLFFLSHHNKKSQIEERIIDTLKSFGYLFYPEDGSRTEKNGNSPIIIFISSKLIEDTEFRRRIALVLSKYRIAIPILEGNCIKQLSKYPETKDLIIKAIDFSDDKDFTLNINQLKSEIEKRIQPEKIAINELFLDPEIRKYCDDLKSSIGVINLSLISKEESEIDLESVYTQLNVDVNFSIKVENYSIEKWWLNRSTLSNSPDAVVTVDTPLINKEILKDSVKTIETLIKNGVDKNYHEARQRPLVLAPPWYTGEKLNFWPLKAEEMALATSKLVILGTPGGGKSTFAKYQAMHMAKSILNIEKQPSLHQLYIPLFIELRHFIGSEFIPEKGLPIHEKAFWQYVESRILKNETTSLKGKIRNAFASGQGLLIFDGLDEIPILPSTKGLTLRRKQIKEFINELVDNYKGSKILVTSREYAYQDWSLDNFETAKIAPLEPHQIKEIAKNLYTHLGFDEQNTRSKLEEFINALDQIPAAFKDYPLFLTLIATLFVRNGDKGLPSKKSDLYEKSIWLLLDRWTKAKMSEPGLIDQLGCSLEDIYAWVEKIAYRTLESIDPIMPKDAQIDFDTIVAELVRSFPDAVPGKILSYMYQQSGVLISPEPESFKFAHRGFHEYFAASYIYREFKTAFAIDNQARFSLINDLFVKNPIIWRETFLLLGSIIAQRSTGPFELLNFIEQIIETCNELDSKYINRYWCTWLTCKLIEEQKLLSYMRSKSASPLLADLKIQIKEILQNSELPVLERIDCANVLGAIGDDRSGVGIVNKCPDIIWCKIDQGSFEMGLTELQKKDISSINWAKGYSFEKEMPSSSIYLPEFHISLYPITKKQFEQFFLSDYSNKSWWTKEGYEWMQNRKAVDKVSADLDGNTPIVRISWYQAVAFCNWLGNLMKAKIRLPTEAEWEKAAKMNPGGIFSWGDEFNKDLCICNTRNFIGPAPVGCFGKMEQGKPQDMSGNVWEWCSSLFQDNKKIFRYPYDKSDGREVMDCDEPSYRIVRGGSYMNPPFVLRTTYRGRDLPSEGHGRIGFRIVKEIV